MIANVLSLQKTLDKKIVSWLLPKHMNSENVRRVDMRNCVVWPKSIDSGVFLGVPFFAALQRTVVKFCLTIFSSISQLLLCILTQSSCLWMRRTTLVGILFVPSSIGTRIRVCFVLFFSALEHGLPFSMIKRRPPHRSFKK